MDQDFYGVKGQRSESLESLLGSDRFQPSDDGSGQEELEERLDRDYFKTSVDISEKQVELRGHFEVLGAEITDLILTTVDWNMDWTEIAHEMNERHEGSWTPTSCSRLFNKHFTRLKYWMTTPKGERIKNGHKNLLNTVIVAPV
jgi:hypothetical protein